MHLYTHDAFRLPRGATGYFTPKEGPLPQTDLRLFKAALHSAARAGGGRAGEMDEQRCPRTFHSASVVHRTRESVVLCHAHHPWIAFARERQDWYGAGDFIEPPPWSQPFAAVGFSLLSAGQLETPLTDLDTSMLSRAERYQIDFFALTTLGGVLFNAWD
ncbi:hypothetical protein AB0A70_12650 [Streptomyces morookaense]|uniref:hypothetical protein n=1 Tax=Streptomyces morookaense TaxID=1970 RepID=UPI0033D603D2